MSDNTCSICIEPLWQVTTNDRSGGKSTGRSSSNSSSGNNDSNDNSSSTAETNAVGAVVPCGHCFHFACFALWRASKGRNCKCPNCNKPSQSCIKIFISPPDAPLRDDDDDDVSLHSTDTNPGAPPNANHDDGENQNEEEEEEEGETSFSVPGESELLPQQESPARDDVIDLTLSPTRQSPAEVLAAPAIAQACHRFPSSSASSNRPSTPTTPTQVGDEVNRFKGIAKRYKRRFQQKDSQYSELYQVYMSVVRQKVDMQDDLKRIQEELSSQNELDEQNAARLDAANLRVVQLQMQCDQQAARIITLEKQKVDLESNYSKLQKSFAKSVQKARNSDMAEVQELLRERPRILEENQNLKRDIAKVTIELSELRRLLRTTGARSTKTITSNATAPLSDRMNSQNGASLTSGAATRDPSRAVVTPLLRQSESPTKKRKASSMAKELRAMAAVQYANGSPLKDDKVTNGRTSCLTTTNQKLSTAGNRMALFFHKKQQQSKLARLGDNRLASTSALTDQTNARARSLDLRTKDTHPRTGFNHHWDQNHHR